MGRFLKGKNGKSLEDSIVVGHKNLEALNEFQKAAVEHFLDIEKRLKSSQKPATTDQKEKPSSVVDTSTQQGSSFFDKYRQTLGRMRGPRFGK